MGFLSLHNHFSNDCILENKGQNYDISKSLLSLTQYLFGIQLWTKVFMGAVEYLESQGEPHSWVHWVIGVQTSALAVEPAVAQGPASAPLSCSPGSPGECCLRLSHIYWKRLCESSRTREEVPAHHWRLDTGEEARWRAWFNQHHPAPKTAELSAKRDFLARDISCRGQWDVWVSACAGHCPFLWLHPGCWASSCMISEQEEAGRVTDRIHRGH